MRLINVSTRAVEEFQGDDIPKYAILSHTWGPEEVTLPEMQAIARHRRSLQEYDPATHMAKRSADHAEAMRLMLLSTMLMAFRGEHPRFARTKALPTLADGYDGDVDEPSHSTILNQTSSHPLEQKAGYSKIAHACSQAQKDGLGYIWIDTCCIDRRSSAELSEAINSIFSWCQRATVCYAYLDDVHFDNYTEGYLTWKDHFNNSRWFTRSWTLQELLAPRKVVFYAKGWRLLGTKSSLVKTIEKITKIDEMTLLEPNLIHSASIAQRMSWAAHRTTTRPEDKAYSLLGIFNVHMPVLYGEGDRAFLRLQEEIIKRSDDHSLFAWGLLNHQSKNPNNSSQSPPTQNNLLSLSSLSSSSAPDLEIDYASLLNPTLPVLARSPSDFAHMSAIVPSPTPLEQLLLPREPVASTHGLTNKGLHITLPLLPHPAAAAAAAADKPSHFLAVLPVCAESNPSELLAIPLLQTAAAPNVFFRARVGGLGLGLGGGPGPGGSGGSGATTKPSVLVPAAELKRAETRAIFIANDDWDGAAGGATGARSRGSGLMGREEEAVVVLRAGDVLSPGYKMVDVRGRGSTVAWEGGVGVIRVGVGERRKGAMYSRTGRQSPLPNLGTLCQIVVVSFWDAHLKRGFMVRVLMEPTTGRCWADLLVPPETQTQAGEGGIVDEAKRLWEAPGSVDVSVPGSGTGKGSRTIRVYIRSAEGEVEAKQYGVHNGDENWAVKPGCQVKVSESVTFAEEWEREYQRTVQAKLDRKKGVVELTLSSMLWLPPPKQGSDGHQPS